ncbi:MAG: hypothetical protein CMD04_00410 [Flavobacteriales bacterium]|nr:hypothetical protein [Flavobacteriales bacterium]|tara:strand:- start:3380 stop:4492 length:1113 start_codon:yes stop_codon:yes gene_type:complete
MASTFNKKIISKKNLFILLLFLGFFSNSNFANQVTFDKNVNSSYLKKIPKNDYILGEGDALFISIVKDVEEFNVKTTIDASGTITLPRLNRIFVKGLSINEFKEILEKEYALFVKEPDIEITIIEHRPVRVFVGGEVESPGLITIPGSYIISDEPLNNEKPFSKDYFFPSIYDAIRKSGGVNYYSDLSNIEVIRINNLSNGGGFVKTNVNFMNFLNGKDISMNLRIYDGDYINIKTSDSPVLNQISQAIRTNLNPEFITVNVSGRVENPGLLQMKKSSSLNDAIYMAGGLRAIRGKINFVRISKEGNLDRRKFAFKRSSERGSYKNPFLQPGDLIYVGKSSFNLANEIIGDITRPFVGLYGTGKFFDLID